MFHILGAFRQCADFNVQRLWTDFNIDFMFSWSQIPYLTVISISLLCVIIYVWKRGLGGPVAKGCPDKLIMGSDPRFTSIIILGLLPLACVDKSLVEICNELLEMFFIIFAYSIWISEWLWRQFWSLFFFKFSLKPSHYIKSHRHLASGTTCVLVSLPLVLHILTKICDLIPFIM